MAKHRRTLNERRSSGPENGSWTDTAATSRAAEKPRTSRVSEDLMRLACLWQAGALSDAEFETAKARVLATYWGTQRPA